MKFINLTLPGLTVLTGIFLLSCENKNNKPESEIKELKPNNNTTMKKVTGIGGIFFKSKDPQKTKEWYNKHLGIETNEYGSLIKWREFENPDKVATTTWSPFSDSTKYFAPSKKEFMVNYRVENLEKLLEQLRKDGVQVVGNMETYEYGKFGWIMDPDDNKIELWEPVDSVFLK